MARDFELDTTRLASLLARSPEAAARGARRGLHDSLDDWVLQARNIAPIDKGTLRRGIKAEEVRGRDMDLTAEISSVAKERNFNYAYYIHELDAGGKNIGGEKKYLDKSAEENKDKWMRWVEEEIRTQLEREGW
ncbi:hypothetical protein [Neobacillus niacini]|uniref:hypothetical protein n=1 Tax=Neobacillus niacini TaxID=86668 RepID=UPI002863E792|nr:hypothetical protein [Neobacillus niacini]MDR7001564.1 hypothetical protein [Neobacillus niacini]